MSDNRYRQKDFHVHLFEEEFTLLEQKAAEAGMSKNEFLREFIVNGEVKNKKELSDTMEKMYALLNDIDYRLRGEIYRAEMADDGAEAGKDLTDLRDRIEALTSLYADAFLEIGQGD